MKSAIVRFAIVAAFAAAVSGCSTMGHHNGVQVAWDTVPAAVQSAIQAHQFGGTVDKVEKETGTGHVVYEAKIKGPDGQYSEVKVADDGKLLKYKTCDKKCTDH